MADSLTVYSENGDKQTILLQPAGVLIGRGADCTVHLKSAAVSRHHARIFQDPFGRWVLEDLGSSNGTWIDGERIAACALLPGKRVKVSNFVLALSEDASYQIPSDSRLGGRTTLSESDTGEMVLADPTRPVELVQTRIQQIDALAERLTDLARPEKLYPVVCQCLAEAPGQMAAVLRLRRESEAEAVELLALHFGGSAPQGENDPLDLMEADVHLSRRVLANVRQHGTAVLASNIHFDCDQMRLTVDDARKPRTVCCAPIAHDTVKIEALYLDLPFDETRTDMLDFARAAARQTELARRSLLLSQEHARQAQIEEQLAWAREIQQRLTPRNIGQIPGVDVATCYRPALWVGGDYCDMWTLPDGRLAVCVADVAGKGLPAAMVMSNLQAGLRATMMFCTELATVMAHLNEHLEVALPADTMITMFLGLYSPSDGRLEYVNAGHMPPIKVTSDKVLSQLGEAINPPLGLPGITFSAAVAQLEPGSGLLLVTDGITEASAPDGTMLGQDGLEKLLVKAPRDSAEKLVQYVVNGTDKFRQKLPQHDDVTILALLNKPR